jgi:hypothetical protein
MTVHGDSHAATIFYNGGTNHCEESMVYIRKRFLVFPLRRNPPQAIMADKRGAKKRESPIPYLLSVLATMFQQAAGPAI